MVWTRIWLYTSVDHNWINHKIRNETFTLDQALGTQTKQFHFHHSEADKTAGLRAYVLDVMDVLKCHQDFQDINDHAGISRAYVTKYVSKCSDAAADEWLNDKLQGTSIAATLLTRSQPYEPELVLQLLGARFKQWDMTTKSRGKRHFVPPVPDAEKHSIEVQMYMRTPCMGQKQSVFFY